MELNKLNPFKIGAIAVGAVAMLWLALNVWTIVPAGHVKVPVLFGKVSDDVLEEGFNIPVNPFTSFDTISIRTDKYEITGLNIPTQDRFNSTGNVTVIYDINADKASYIRKEFGNIDQFIDKTLRQQLRSIIRSEGRKLADSRALAQDVNVSKMQMNTATRLRDALETAGINIQEVLVQDIAFDPRIAKQILDTQRRIQNEEQKKSDERIAKTEAAIKKEQAIGEGNKKREAADAEAYREKTEAEGRKEAAISRAQGKAQSITLQAKAEADAIKLMAEANRDLARSITPALLEYKRIENEAILYSKSRGEVPTTIIGDTDLRAIGVPVATGTK